MFGRVILLILFKTHMVPKNKSKRHSCVQKVRTTLSSRNTQLLLDELFEELDEERLQPLDAEDELLLEDCEDLGSLAFAAFAATGAAGIALAFAALGVFGIFASTLCSFTDKPVFWAPFLFWPADACLLWPITDEAEPLA